MKIPRIVLAGATSGVGKTLISCGLVRALQKQGYSVQPFKVGPDYIDPSYLSSISRHEACNLDAWLMGKDHILRSFVSNSTSDVSVIEGVMGFYDGVRGDSNFASTHHIASLTKSPVVLVLDASKTSRSIAATALGFQKFHPRSRILGVILNKLGSKKHEELCRQSLECINLSVLGAIYRDSELGFKSRHLGLIPTTSDKRISKKLLSASDVISDSLNISSILDILNAAPPLPKFPKLKSKKHRATISVALDSSFNFYYRDNLTALQREGATLKFFSPVGDHRLPKSDGIYIGGGFPEVLGHSLERNHSMRKKIKQLAEDGVPVYAECGGLMYLTKYIRCGSKKYRMAGLFDVETVMTNKMSLSYTKGQIASKTIISDRHHALYGHEFHYSEINSVPDDSKFAYDLKVGTGIQDGSDGIMAYNTLASYGHLYFGRSNYAATLLASCLRSSRR